MQIIKKLALGASVFIANVGIAFANPCGGTGLPACEIPEPSSLPLLGLGLVGAIVVARYFKK